MDFCDVNDTFLDNIFYRKYLICPQEFPLHEVFYYNDVANVRVNLNGAPRGTIQSGLATPHHYVQVWRFVFLHLHLQT